jgi:hypothetical protein
LIESDLTKPLKDQNVTPDLINAVITEQGSLTSQYEKLMLMYETLEFSKTFDRPMK